MDVTSSVEAEFDGPVLEEMKTLETVMWLGTAPDSGQPGTVVIGGAIPPHNQGMNIFLLFLEQTRAHWPPFMQSYQ